MNTDGHHPRLDPTYDRPPAPGGPLSDPAYVAGLRPIPSGSTADQPSWPASDLKGVRPDGSSIEIRIADAGHRILLVFLSTQCDGCDEFWRGLGSPDGTALPGSVSAVVVTRGTAVLSAAEVEAASDLLGSVPVVMTDAAWSDYRVTGYPFLVLVDPETRTVIGETVGFGWSDVQAMIRAGDSGACPLRSETTVLAEPALAVCTRPCNIVWLLATSCGLVPRSPAPRDVVSELAESSRRGEEHGGRSGSVGDVRGGVGTGATVAGDVGDLRQRGRETRDRAGLPAWITVRLSHRGLSRVGLSGARHCGEDLAASGLLRAPGVLGSSGAKSELWRARYPPHSGALGPSGQRLHAAHGSGDAHLRQADADRPAGGDGPRARHPGLAGGRTPRRCLSGGPGRLGCHPGRHGRDLGSPWSRLRLDLHGPREAQGDVRHPRQGRRHGQGLRRGPGRPRWPANDPGGAGVL